MFENWPRLSVRAAASTLQISHTTVHHILRRCLFLYPYKVQSFHGLSSSNKVKRVSFARHYQKHHSGYWEYLSKIVFSDEDIFRLNGSVNKQNVRIWGTERPNEGNQSLLNSPSVIVWCAIAKEKAIGSCFFEDENVNGENTETSLCIMLFQALHLWGETTFFTRIVRLRIILLESKRSWTTKDWITGLGEVGLPNGLHVLQILHPATFLWGT